MTRSLSHVAIGVRDMDASLRFYRDLLGFLVTLDDPEENPGSAQRTSRRGVYLRWPDESNESFLVLNQNDPPRGRPLRLNDVGIHHIAFWVDDLDASFARARAAGVHVVMEPRPFDAKAYGEESDNRYRSCMFHDPDGVIIQLDQRVSA